MPSFISDHPMLCALALIFIDIAVSRLISANLSTVSRAGHLPSSTSRLSAHVQLITFLYEPMSFTFMPPFL